MWSALESESRPDRRGEQYPQNASVEHPPFRVHHNPKLPCIMSIMNSRFQPTSPRRHDMASLRNLVALILLLGLAASALAQRSVSVTTRVGDAPPLDSASVLPHNFYGAHLLVDSASGKAGEQLRWARHLVGRWGHAKTLFMGIDARTQEPAKGWVEYVNACYKLELIPVLRLAGRMENGIWVKPQADAPGDYSSMAKAIRRVVEGLPRSPKCPLYVELWNEPNLDLEWSGRADPAEYAAFFVQAVRAIREIGDPRIKVLNAGLATRPEWTEKLCQLEPDFIKSFDLWASHPYPGNRPPSLNHHDRTAPPGDALTIDAYLLELDVLKRLGLQDVRVMLTETGYELGNSVFTRDENHAIIDEYIRADYIVRAFRDYYPKWKELTAVIPFVFSNENWKRFNWVHPDSGTNPDGSPTRPHYQYTAVAALAKPTDLTGAISGTITVAGLNARLGDVAISGAAGRTTSDPMGNYFLPKVRPGVYRVHLRKTGYADVHKSVTVRAGANTVFDAVMEPRRSETLSGTVTSGDDGRPLSGVKITLQPGNLVARTDSRGVYKIKEAVPTGYRLIAEAPGRYRHEAKDILVEAGKTNIVDFCLGKLPPHLPNENLLSNPSMETDGGGAALPGLALGFEPANEQGRREANTAISERVAHTGRRSQEMRVRPEETQIRQITHYNTANPGERYVAGVWIRTDIPDRDGAAWMSLDFVDNAGVLIKRFAPQERIRGRRQTWKWVEVDGEAPTGARRLAINFHTQGQAGLAWFDDAHLSQVPRRR
jgi:hypothetical protein